MSDNQSDNDTGTADDGGIGSEAHVMATEDELAMDVAELGTPLTDQEESPITTATSTSTSTYKVLGELSEPGGVGVVGLNTATSGASRGVKGRVDSGQDGAAGVEGYATTSDVAHTHGVLGVTEAEGDFSADATPYGVIGTAKSNVGPCTGVGGWSVADNGAGVYGRATSSTGVTAGVRGVSESPDGSGVVGNSTSTSGFAPGVKGTTKSKDNSAGVFGHSQATTGSNFGVLGKSESEFGFGTGGYAAASNGTTYGVYGRVDSADGYGIYTPNDAGIEGRIDTAETDFVVEAGTTSTFDAQNVLQGHSSNRVSPGVVGATISGGGSDDGEIMAYQNIVRDDYGTVGGGAENVAGSNDSDTTTAPYATVSGGEANTASGTYATVGGGAYGSASGQLATVPGGYQNTAAGACSFAAGRVAIADHDGAFVFGDSTTNTATSSAADEVRFQAGGGFVIQATQTVTIENGLPTGSGDPLHIDSSGQLVRGSASSARYKTDIRPLSTDTRDVLDLEPRAFTFEETDQSDVGLIAEDVDETVPDLALYDDDGRPDGVRYSRLAVYLLPEVRRNRDDVEDQQRDIETLESNVEILQTEREDLAAENERLRERVENLESENERKAQRIEDLEAQLGSVEERLADLEASQPSRAPADD